MDDLPRLYEQLIPDNGLERRRVAAAVLLRLCLQDLHDGRPRSKRPRAERLQTYVFALPDAPRIMANDFHIGKPDEHGVVIAHHTNAYMHIPGATIVPPVNTDEQLAYPVVELIQASFIPEVQSVNVALRGLEEVITPDMLGHRRR